LVGTLQLGLANLQNLAAGIGHVACIGYRRGAYRVLVKRSEVKRPPGKPRHRWEDNIKMVLQEV
jgi:hypothetical protein